MPPTGKLPTRRDFIRLSCQGMGLAAVAGLTPKLLGRPSLLSSAPANDRVLVIIHLAGGNDGLNTVIPYADSHYAKHRPRLAIPSSDVLRLDENFGLHPSMPGLRTQYNRGNLAIVHNVGYPQPNRSHFGATRAWTTAHPDDPTIQTGWLGRFLEQTSPSGPSPTTIHFSTQTPAACSTEAGQRIAKYDHRSERLSFASETTVSSTLTEPRLRGKLRESPVLSDYPPHQFARDLRSTAQLIDSDLTTQLYHITLNGFDTHSHQLGQHETALRTLSESLTAFQADLKIRGIDEKVLTFAFSEFGRRPTENAARGTDHGTAGPVFLLGPKVKGGFHGTPPDLSLPAFADLEASTDFRQIYATLLEDWLHTPAHPVLGEDFTKPRYSKTFSGRFRQL